jgi:hypothetical protein
MIHQNIILKVFPYLDDGSINDLEIMPKGVDDLIDFQLEA